MKFGAVVLAAGMSSRMGMFKPLLPFRGSTIIENAILSLKNGGVENICVVTGRNGREVENVIAGYKVKTVHNADYENTDMLTSLKLGLEQVKDTDAVFILPGDIPNVQPETISALMEKYKNTNFSIIYPCYHGKKGHPPLIGKSCYEAIFQYQGDEGLRDILSFYKDSSYYMETKDKGCITDIDYKEDYENLLLHLTKE